MSGTQVTYEEVEDAYNVVQEPQSKSSYLIEMPNLNAIGKVSGTVKIQSKTKLTLDPEFSKNEDGSFTAVGTDKTNLDYSEVTVTQDLSAT